MSMTGHKSVQSLTYYQRVGEKTKKEMGQVLSNSLKKKDDLLMLECQPGAVALSAPPPPLKVNEPPPLPNDSNLIVPYVTQWLGGVDSINWDVMQMPSLSPFR